MKRLITVTAILLLLSFLLHLESGMAGTVDPGLEARIGKRGPSEMVPVLILLKDQLELHRFKSLKPEERRQQLNRALRLKAARSQSRLITLLHNSRAHALKPLWIVNAVAARVPITMIQTLADQPEVAQVLLDGKVPAPTTDFSSSIGESTWNIAATHAPELWQQGYDGTGVVVAVMDTGVDIDHNDLKSRWRGGTNSWYDPNGEHPTPYDHDGHGTRATGIILGGDATGVAIGMAPGARWIGVKIFADNGEASFSAIHLGFQWLLDPDNDPQTHDQPQLVNNSWGLEGLVDQCFTEFQPDIQILRASGIGVVFAAGNSGPAPATTISPANYPESFAVGALDKDLLVARFSSRGPSACSDDLTPAITAPGVEIRTTDLTFGGLFPENSAVVDGTSFAAPHITGAMALLKTVRPWLTADDLELVLTLSARDLAPEGVDNDSGYGLVDMSQALYLLENQTCTGPDGNLFYSPEGCGTTPGTQIQGEGGIIPALQLLLGHLVPVHTTERTSQPSTAGKVPLPS